MASSIDGRVFDARSREPLPGMNVEAVSQTHGDSLGSGVTNADAFFSVPVNPRRWKQLVTEGEQVGFRVTGPNQEPYDATDASTWSGREPDQIASVVVRKHEDVPNGPAGSVQGVVTDHDGVAAAGVGVLAVDHSVAGERQLAGATTGGDGRYVMTYDLGVLGDRAAPDLEVRALGPDGGVLASSGIQYDAPTDATVDLVVDRAKVPTPPEHARVVDAVRTRIGDRPLDGLTADTVGYLAGRTGWDPRLVAMTARAEQLNAQTQIPAEHYYALMRAGLPGDPAELHRLSDDALVGVLKDSIADGVISADTDIDATVRLHAVAAREALRELKPEGAVSSLGDMLALRLDPDRQTALLDALRETAENPDALWSRLADRGFDEATVSALQTDAVLGDLTHQNAPVISRLTELGVSSPAELADRGLHEPAAWGDVIRDDVPDGVDREAYAQGLAAQVRRRFSTRVTAELVRSGSVNVGDASQEVAGFLAARGEQAGIGIAPVRSWDGFANLSAAGQAGALKVERLYQITPSNASMQTLSSLGFDSAHQLARYSPDGFVAAFGDHFPTPLEARLTHRKAQQVNATTLGVAATYLAYRGAPNVYAISGHVDGTAPEPHPEIDASATLEQLFGNLDYCTCDHCHSVLSPAAYLVELLEMLDLADVPHPKDNPIEVLLGRRPDLAHLALSCENTNVALPYLDVVLEILEFWVVNGNLTAFAGHDVQPGTESADLLADRAFVLDAAYDTTKAAVYPWALPFDAPLEHLRQLFAVWDTTLPAALDVFGPPAAARREWLRLNASEHAILTDATFRELPEYFGEPAGTTLDQLNDAVANAKTFCRRTGLTYAELVDVLASRFANPGAVLTPLLTALHVPLEKLQARYDGTLSDAELLALLPDDLDRAPYGGDVPAWLDANRTLITGTITLTATSDGADACDFGDLELRFALPDPPANRLDEISYHRLHRFLRLWKKLGWTVAATDEAITALLGADPAGLTTATIDAAFTALLDRLAGFVRLTTRLDLSAAKRAQWLALLAPDLDPTARHQHLATLLRIGTTDLTTLLELAGLDPFADDLGSSTPSLGAVVDAVAAVKGSALKVTDLDFLLRDADTTGKRATPIADQQRDLVALRQALAAVDADLAAPAGTTDLAGAAAKMALVYAAPVVDRFLALVAGTTAYAVPLSTPEEALPAKLTTIAPAVRIDPFHGTLATTGPLGETSRAALAAAADTLVLADVENIAQQADLDAFVADLKTALQLLHDAATADLDELGNEYPELRTLYDAVAALPDPGAQAAAIVADILPGLRSALRLAALRTTLATVLKATPELVDALTSGPGVLHADGNPAESVLTDVAGLERAPDLGTDGTFDLLLAPPTTAEYLFYVAAPPGTQVTLEVAGTAVLPTAAVDADGERRSSAGTALTAGALVPARLTVAGLPGGGHAELRWRTNAVAKTAVPATRLFVASAFERADRSLRRLRKVVMVAGALALTPVEVTDLGRDRAETKGVWDGLAVDATTSAADVHADWMRVAELLRFAALKTAYETEENQLSGVLRDPGALDPRGGLVVAGVMGWAEADLAAVLSAFGLTIADLGALTVFRRVVTAMDLVATTLQPAADLVTWAVPDPDGALVRTIRATLRLRMSEASWRESMQSVSDEVRNACRDALVAYILHHAVPRPEIETPDQLYEYFLVDVQMDACMQTSRIRLALSTVQLFVNRCLLGLEPRVSPTSVNADHWAWMRRYRVWEANRKVFLYPENWLEPELRDGKSPFFRDLESELLKADITQDLAETAYLHYLKKLDDIARLEVVGAYLEQRDPGTLDDDVLHVLGRTLGSTREHWYRRYEYGYWTPWEKVGLNIEGDVVVPVVWKKRLFVFWTTSVVSAHGDPTKTPQDMSDEAWSGAARVDATVTLHRGEYYRGQWTSPKSTETTTSLTFGYLTSFDPALIRMHTRTYVPDTPPGAPPRPERLEVWLGYRGGPTVATYFLTFTSTNSAPHVYADDPFWVYLGREAQLLEQGRNPVPAVDANSWVYGDREFTVRVEQPSDPKAPIPMQVLTKGPGLLDGFRVRPTVQTADNPWEQPLFYTDERSVFFVAGDEQLYRERPRWYVDDAVLGTKMIKTPPKAFEEAVKPVIPKPGDPVIDPTYAVRLPGNVAFTYGGTTFDAGGVARARTFDAGAAGPADG